MKNLFVRDRTKIFWGWYVVFGGFLLLSITYGSRYSFGVFVKPMFTEYHWPMSTISLGASINILMYAIGGILSGRLVDRMPPKWIIMIGAVTASMGFFLTSMAQTPVQFYLSYGILCGLGSACMGVVVTSSSVGKWFVKRRGTAIGITTMGVAFGTMLFTPIAGYIVKNYHWSKGFVFFGIVLLIASALISQTFMKKSKPEDYGLSPDGRGQKIGDLKNIIPFNAETAIPLSDVLKNPVFWIMSFCFSIGAVAELMVFVHLVSFSVNNNIEKVAAASSLGIIGIASLCGRFFFGWLCDNIKDPKYAASIGSLLMAAGMLLLLNMDSSIALLYTFALIFGFGYASTSTLMPIMVSDRFGRSILGSTYGLLT
ncbi:MAG: MFS transporter, partial [Deltaproteobacteria bacterium]|nr:MFS transporter [Deltaproteobacteria bacterium]